MLADKRRKTLEYLRYTPIHAVRESTTALQLTKDMAVNVGKFPISTGFRNEIDGLLRDYESQFSRLVRDSRFAIVANSPTYALERKNQIRKWIEENSPIEDSICKQLVERLLEDQTLGIKYEADFLAFRKSCK
jgi:hypothetical protein